MRNPLETLTDVYRKEGILYRRILDEVREQGEEIRSGASYRDINEGLRRKRDLLKEVELLESGIREERKLWNRRKKFFSTEDAGKLMTLLEEVTLAIEEILEAERENEIHLTTRRRKSVPVIASADKVRNQYRKESRVEVGS
ncbi:MAG: hypothetical protein QF492_03810 [Candidatus Krumholzibacteria bacterium]|jgi:hypothetical protein|nr:hypothetical protein [Candidatus Krumholzibacteria bacterium]MDP6669023.1 hypothetical protein [Candidatus Krumholzibacteria bacterium]MDP6796301.1 hypothetical protein [Candidatus Krumholzibacteria bacterium]MDP7020962.1 hypothetical protein [Candidatus Krumholzibacteria bacterium]